MRTFNVIDESNREGLAIEIGTSIPSARIIRVFDRLIEIYGKPSALRTDNAPEFTATLFQEWCQRHGTRQLFIQPGKPNQNAFMERFNRSYRTELLNLYLFETIDHVQQLSNEWLHSLQPRATARQPWPGATADQYAKATNQPSSLLQICLLDGEASASEPVARSTELGTKPERRCLTTSNGSTILGGGIPHWVT